MLAGRTRARDALTVVTLAVALAAVVACASTGAAGPQEGPTRAAEPQEGPTRAAGPQEGMEATIPTSSTLDSIRAVDPGHLRFRGTISRLHGETRSQTLERNWHPGCPVPIHDLRVVTVAYRGFDHELHEGPLVVNERVASDVLDVFRRLYRAHFRIKHIALARRYRPNDDRWDSTRDTTAAFNCRPVTGSPGSLSQHSYGWAIDINPLQNPYVRSNGSVLRRAAKPYRDRSLDEPGMIHADGIVVRAFQRIGWGWGGDFSSIKDYMHFSLTGR